MKSKYTTQKRLEILSKLLEEKRSVSEICREYGISRTLFYRWLRRYKDSSLGSIENRLTPRKRQGLHYSSQVSGEAERKIIQIVKNNPEYSIDKIRNKLPRSLRIGRHGVQKVLERYKLSTWQERVRFANRKSRGLPAQREVMIRRVLEGKESVSDVCKDYRISRPVFYKWLERYKSEDIQGLWDRVPDYTFHTLRATEEQEGAVLDVVRRNPELSVAGIVEYLPRIRGRPILGNHGIQNVLVRHGLNTFEKRLVYAGERGYAVTPSVRPELSWLERLKISVEQFLPSRAPAPPPGVPSIPPSPAPFGAGLRGLRPLAFLKHLSPYILSIFLLTISLYGWGYLFGQADNTQQAIGFLFSGIALSMGSIFFLYSLKYYLTLAMVLSFSRELGEGGVRSKEQGVGSKVSWLARMFGIADKQRPGPASPAGGPFGDTQGGLDPNISDTTLERYPFISVHLPMYNERRVAERLLRACTSFEYHSKEGSRESSSPQLSRADSPLNGVSTSLGSVSHARYEIIVADDSTDETQEIVKDFADNWNQNRTENQPIIKVIHRDTRKGFKGAALQNALKHTDKRAEFITVFDADFVPYPDSLELFVKYFQSSAGSLNFRKVNQEREENSKLQITNNKQIQNPNYQNSKLNQAGSKQFDNCDLRFDNSCRIAAVQGYQWHVLNKSENWITRGVRSEYAGSYVVERSGSELYKGLKQIAGSVYMVRRDLLDKIGWGSSITEDFQLTLKLYSQGYKVVYTPYIQAPSECVSTLKRLIRQRMRWAEGHSHNIRRMFTRLMFGKWADVSGPAAPGLQHSQAVRDDSAGLESLPAESSIKQQTAGSKQFIPSPLTLSEKLELLYLSPYYLQAAFFLLGTIAWLISETIFKARLPFWTAVWGWSLVLTNMISLPLMNSIGLFLEEAEEKDFTGTLSFILLSYILVPFQAYAAIKGFIEPEEGPWFRTPKTGKVTDVIRKGRLYQFLSELFPGRISTPADAVRQAGRVGASTKDVENISDKGIEPIGYHVAPDFAYARASARLPIGGFSIKRRQARWIGRTMLSILILVSTTLTSITPYIPVATKQEIQPSVGSGSIVSPETSSTIPVRKKATNRDRDTKDRLPSIVRQAYAQEDTSNKTQDTSSELISISKDDIQLTTEKTDYKATETPSFTISETDKNIIQRLISFIKKIFKREETPLKERVEIKLIHETGDEITSFKTEAAEDGELEVSLDSETQMKPGRYTIKVVEGLESFDSAQDEQEGKLLVSQDFTWGVLAINTNKSMYALNEEAYIQMAVLDEYGDMVCNAELELKIKTSEGQIDRLSIANGKIRVNRECQKHEVTSNPDYYANYQVGNPGTYQMTLKANTNSGEYEITDSFEVKEEKDIPFDIERITATRVYPLAEYPVSIKITANQDFEGTVKETVPGNFGIVPPEDATNAPYSSIQPSAISHQPSGTTKAIIWNVNMKKGETHTLGYRYDAPDKSPAFYLLGPLRLASSDQLLAFSESRQWQLAIDATTGLLYPTADGFYDNWDNGSVNCTTGDCSVTVDEETPGSGECAGGGDSGWSDPTSFAADKATVRQSFDVDESTIPDNSEITSIDITACMEQQEGGAAPTVRFFARHGTTDYDGATTETLSTTWTEYNEDITGLSITKTAGSDLEIGIEHTAGAKTTRATEMWATVTYTPKINVSGIIYQTEGGSALANSEGTVDLINSSASGTTYQDTSGTDGSGAFTIPNVALPTDGDDLTIWLNGATGGEQTTMTLKYGSECNGGSGSDCTGLELYEDTVVIRNAYTGSVSNQDLSDCDGDGGTGCGDGDIGFTSNISGTWNLQTTSGWELHIWDSDTHDPGGSITTQGSGGDFHIDGSATAYFDTTGNTISDDITVDASATLNFDQNVAMSGADGTADITVTGDSEASTGTLTFNESGTISGAGSDIDFFDIDVATSGKTLTINATTGITLDGGDLSSTGTASITYSANTPTVTLTGAGTLGGGSGTHKFYNLTANGSSNTTTLSSNNALIDNALSVGTSHEFAMQTNNVTIGNTGDANSGDISMATGATTSQSASGTVTILAASGTSDWEGPGEFDAYNLTIGNGSVTFSVDNETGTDLVLDVANDFTISASAEYKASTTSDFRIQGSWANSGTFTANQGEVTMDDTDGGETLTGTMTSGSAFYDLTFNDGVASGAWTFAANSATVTRDFKITGGTVTAPSTTLSVGRDFTNSDGFTHASGTVTLSGAVDTTQTITGATTFSTLSNTTEDKIIKFAASTTFAVTDLTLQGSSCTNLVVLRSTTPGTEFTLNNNDATATVSYADIQDFDINTNAITATNSVDSGNNDGGGVSWTFNTKTCVGSSTDNQAATGYSFQRKTFYDSDNSTYWLFYHDGDEIEIRYSQNDGDSWTTESDVPSTTYDTNDFSVWHASISSVEYVWLAVVSSGDIIVERGTLTGGDINWEASTETAMTDGTGSFAYPSIALDSSNIVWVMARFYSGSQYFVDVADSQSAGNGTWGSINFNSETKISNANGSTNIFGSIVPLGSQHMYANFIIDTDLMGCYYDADQVGGARWEKSDDSAVCVPGSDTTSYYFNAADADYLADDSNDGRKEMTTTLGTTTQTQNLNEAGDTFYILTDNQSQQWTADKAMTTSTTGEKRNIDMATDASGNSVAVWEDSRNSDGVNDSFSDLSSGRLIGRRRTHTATLLSSGKVLMAGGLGGSDLSTAEIFDPSTNTFSDLSTGMMIGSRYSHTATLLNNGKILMAGGYSAGYLSTAELFDPASSTFSDLSSGKMIGRRQLHTATLLSSGKVLMAGGGTTLPLSTAELYDPATNTFSDLDSGRLIGRRQDHTATLLNNGMVLIAGGYTGAALSTAELYDPATNTFSETSGRLSGRRYLHTATLLNNGKVLIAGGSSGGAANLSTAELFDPAANTFSDLDSGRLIGRRRLHTATLLNNGKVLMAGGWDGDILSTAEIYDSSANTFSDLDSGRLIGERDLHTATLLNNGKVLVSGGNDGAILSTAELYTPQTYDVYAQKYSSTMAEQWDGDGGVGGNQDVKVNSDDGNAETNGASNYDHLNPKVKLDDSGNAIVVWQESRNSVFGDDIYAQKLKVDDGTKLWPAAAASVNKFASTTGILIGKRYVPSATLLNSGKVLIAGGFIAEYLSTAEIYDPTTNTFSDLASGRLIGMRDAHSATLLNSGKVLMAGGYGAGGRISTAELYDPANETFSDLTSGMLIGKRALHTGTLLTSGKVLVTGGYGVSSTITTAELFDPEAQTFSSTTGGLVGDRYYHKATLLANGKVLIVGGDDGEELSTAEIYDPIANNFSNLTSGRLSGRRRYHTATLLNNGKVLVAGGSDGAYLSTAELFDPVAETFSSTTGGLVGDRAYHTATLLNSGKVLIAGGNNGYYLSTAEIYDPATNNFSDLTSGRLIGKRLGHTATLLNSGKVLIAAGADADWLSTAELFTPSGDVAVSNDGSAKNGYGLPIPEFPGRKGMTGEQRKPVLGIDSNNDVIVAWEDKRFDSIQNWGVSFDYDANAWWQTNNNLAVRDCGGGGWSKNSCGALAAINSRPLRIMGQKLSSGDGAKSWGDDVDVYNKNNPQDLILSSSGDVNRNPSIAIDGTDVILTWDSNAAIEAESGNMKREGNVYAQKFNSSGESQWGSTFAYTEGTMNVARYAFTATLLGSGKVLVVGGCTGTGSCTGKLTTAAELFDPATGTFSTISGLNAARRYATATLLNSGKVLIAGGSNSVTTSEIFDPVNNNFAYTTGGLGEATESHTATLLGNGTVLIAGGCMAATCNGNNATRAEIYDPVDDNFAYTTGGLQHYRSNYASSLLPDGRVLLTGHYDSPDFYSSAEMYDPVNDNFTFTSTHMNVGRNAHTATLLNSGKVLIAGGPGTNPPWTVAELFDPLTGTFTVTSGGLKDGRYLTTPMLLNNGEVLFAGGNDGTAKISSAELYNPIADTFTFAKGGLNKGVYGAQSVLLSSGKVLVIGGVDPGNSSKAELYSVDQMLNSGVDLADQSAPVATYSASSDELFFAWQGMRGSGSGGGRSFGDSDRGGMSKKIYGQKMNNPDSGSLTNQWPDTTGGHNADTFKDLSSGMMIGERVYHTATLLNNGKVLIAGGRDEGSSYLSTAEIYDPAAETFSDLDSGMMIGERYWHTATLLNNGKVLIAGGTSDTGVYLSTAELYDPEAQTFSDLDSGRLIGKRYGHTATLLKNGKVLIAGGWGTGGYLSTAELFDPAANTFSETPGGLIGERIRHTATLLASGKVLIAGGDDGADLSTAELFDPTNNTFSQTLGGLIGERDQFTATLLNNGKVLIAGGDDGDYYLSTAEIYDPAAKTFSDLTSGRLIGRRMTHTATLLASGKVLMAGGLIIGATLSTAEIYDPAAETFSDLTSGRLIGRRNFHTATLLNNGKVLMAGGGGGQVRISRAELYNPSGEVLLSHDFGMAGDQVKPKIMIGDYEDPIVVWQDNRPAVGDYIDSNITSDWNVFMQKIDATTGEPLWPASRTSADGYSAPYAVMDVRVDGANGLGTHYSGKPAIGGMDDDSLMYIGWESNLDDGNAAAGECGYSNSNDQVRVCGQSYDITEQNPTADVNWEVYFYAAQVSGTPQLTVNADIAEWDGVQIAKESNDRAWTYTSDQMESFTFDSGGSNPPPTDTIGNISMRRFMVKFTWVADSVNIEYDDDSPVRNSRLDIGIPGTQDDIDDVASAAFSDGLSNVADGTNVHLLFADDLGQISYLRRTGSSWGAVKKVTYSDANDAYPSISRDTDSGDIYAVYIDTSGDKVHSSQCDISGSADCATWGTEQDVATSDTFTNVTSNYSGPTHIMAMWSVGSAAPYHVGWDTILIPEKLWLFMGMAPLIPLLLRRKRKKAYAVQR